MRNGRASGRRAGLRELLLGLCLAAPPLSAAQPLANRPNESMVPAGLPAVIDGVWRVVENQRLFLVRGGRMVTLQDYEDVGFLVRTGMVMVQEIAATGPSTFRGRDPGWNIAWTATVTPSGQLQMIWHSLVGPARYSAVPVQLADDAAFARLTGGGAVGSYPAVPGQPPAQPGTGQPGAACSFTSYDPATGRYVCIRN